MITKRVIGTLSAALACALAAAPGHADFVTYQASGVIEQADNAALLPSGLSGASVGQNLSVYFTVDTSAPGSGTPDFASYQASVVSAFASIGSGNVGLGVDSTEIQIYHNTASGGVYSTGFYATSNSNTPFNGDQSVFQLLTFADDAAPLNLYQDTSLSNAPLKPGDANLYDQLDLQFNSYSNGNIQSVSDLIVNDGVSVQSVSSVSAPEIDPTSAGSALMLLIGSLAVLCGRRPIKVRE